MEKPSNFLTEIIDADLAEGRVKQISSVLRMNQAIGML